ncbi:polysaccharide lyase 8 family protein [Kribbella shirazensis]|uniref:Hyaluronate lyase n=1 Tax=Kribbella shirazensis TaxID=1105143 RepID=A0A7X5VK19_9ACTN|nr:polysaccharide lyase 8 family protein [Kribbella shirazensis]NIK61553.1 hyaluronate lyase [Kribbella shirazensis]
MFARRTFITAVGAVAVAGALRPASARAATAEDFAAARAVLHDILTGGTPDPANAMIKASLADVDARADELSKLLDRRADRDRAFVDLPLDAPNMRTTYERLRDLALAYATPGATRHGDAALAQDVISGLRVTHDRIYHHGGAKPGNWWFWVIGGPRSLLWTAALVHDVLPAADLADYSAAVKWFVPDPGVLDPAEWVGSNGSDVIEISILDGILTDDEGRITRGVEALAPLLPLVTKSDGFYADGSYIGHSVYAYTGSYGMVQLGGLARLFALLAATPWQIDNPDREDFFGVVEKSYAPLIHDGKMMDLVRGRAISVQLESDRIAGYITMEHILRLAQAVDPERALRWRSLVKGWLARDTAKPFPPRSPRWGFGPARVSLFAQVLDDPAIPAAAEREEHRQFPVMDRAVHRRNDWTYAISMSSRRIGYYEAINDQNKHGWHTGSGMTYLYNGDDTQFTDDFWPTVDPYRLPGTTADTTPLPVGAGSASRPNTTWVGGVTSTSGNHGLVGMAVRGIVAPGATQVQARKAWFCLDEQVVALGAGITGGGTEGAGGRFPVVTTVENRNLHEAGAGTLTVDGAVQPGEAGWSGEFGGVGWAHLEGVGGYLFPAGGTIRAVRADRTASWRDIDSGSAAGTTDPVTRRYLTLWFDHGIEPRDASYAYALVPGASARRTAQLAAASQVEILANTPTKQAIRLLNRDVVMAAFFAPGSQSGITVDAAVAIIVESDGRYLTIAVADPTRAATPIHVTLDRATTKVLTHDAGLVVTAGPTTKVTANLSGTVGSTRTTRLLLA